MAITFLSGSTNPDSSSIAYKEQIDISLTLVDVSASAQSQSVYPNINTNYAGTIQKVIVPELGLTDSSLYYTPIYKEKLDYKVWLNRINKNFDELD